MEAPLSKANAGAGGGVRSFCGKRRIRESQCNPRRDALRSHGPHLTADRGRTSHGTETGLGSMHACRSFTCQGPRAIFASAPPVRETREGKGNTQSNGGKRLFTSGLFTCDDYPPV